MVARRGSLLTKLLHLLVEEWGYDEVLRALTRLPYLDGRPITDSKAEKDRTHKGSRQRDHKSDRFFATDQIIILEMPGDRKDVLLGVAAKFDRKEFLPNLSDIREFILMMGSNGESVRDRSDGFRRLLPILLELPLDRLEYIARSNRHSGPARLGPLADAIRSAGEAMRRVDRADGTVAGGVSSEGPEGRDGHDASGAVPEVPSQSKEEANTVKKDDGNENISDKVVTRADDKEKN